MASRRPPDLLERTLTDEQLIEAVAAVCERQRERGAAAVGASAADVAFQLGIRHDEGAKRHGNGAVQGSYSGHMSASLRVAPQLGRLFRAGRLRGELPVGEYRWVYWSRPETDSCTCTDPMCPRHKGLVRDGKGAWRKPRASRGET